MSEEIRKKIEDHARKELYAETNNGRNWMPTRKELQILTRIEAAEFGYQLAQEEFKPSQDELWEELEDNCMGYDEGSGGFLVINEAKKRYRITRI